MLVLWLLQGFVTCALAINSSSNSLDGDVNFYDIPPSEYPNWFHANYNSLAQLSTLHLVGCIFDENSIRDFAALLAVGRYTSISIEEGNFNEQFVADILSFPPDTLTSFKLANVSVQLAGLFELLNKLPPSIESLHVERIQYDDAKLAESFSIPTHLVNLKQISWREMKYFYAPLVTLFKCVCLSNLNRLDLSGNSVHNLIYEWSTERRYLSNVECLILRDCGLDFALNLASLLTCYPNLTEIDLSDNRLEFAFTCNTGPQLPFNRNMKKITLDNNSIYSDDLVYMLTNWKHSRLEELKINTISGLDFSNVMRIFVHWNLKVFSIALAKVFTEQAKAFFDDIINFGYLEEFTLHTECAEDKPLDILFEKISLMDNLKKLGLKFWITSRHYKPLLNALSTLKRLTTLSFSLDQIDGNNEIVYPPNLLSLELHARKCQHVESLLKNLDASRLENLKLNIDSLSNSMINIIVQLLINCTQLKSFSLSFASTQANNVPDLGRTLLSIREFTFVCNEKNIKVLQFMEMLLSKMPNLINFNFSIAQSLFYLVSELVSLRGNMNLRTINFIEAQMTGASTITNQLDISRCIHLQSIRTSFRTCSSNQRFLSLSMPAASFLHFLLYEMLPARFPHSVVELSPSNLANLFIILTMYCKNFVSMAKRRNLELFERILPIQNGILRIDLLYAFLSFEYNQLIRLLSSNCTTNDNLNLRNLYALIAIVVGCGSAPSELVNLSPHDISLVCDILKTRKHSTVLNTQGILLCDEDYLNSEVIGLQEIVAIVASPYCQDGIIIEKAYSVIEAELMEHPFSEKIHFINNFTGIFVNPNSLLFNFYVDMKKIYELLFGINDRLFCFLWGEIELSPVEVEALSALVNVVIVKQQFQAIQIEREEFKVIFNRYKVDLYACHPNPGVLLEALKRFLYLGAGNLKIEQCVICTQEAVSTELSHPNEVNGNIHIHGFHAKCLHDWMKIKRQCPVCRLSLA